MLGQFRPITGVMQVGIGRFSLPGDNVGFCEAILRKSAGSAPLRLESLTYARSAEREAAPGAAVQQPLVVNLLMQLRTYYDQSNTFLRTQTALNVQLTHQLRQVLASSNGAVRARAGEIERAVRENLYRDGEFRRAVDTLARELKKNDDRTPELTVWLPGPAAAAGPAGRRPSAAAAGRGTRQQETPALRASVFPAAPPALPALEQRLPVPDGGGESGQRRGETLRRSAGQGDRPASGEKKGGRRSGRKAGPTPPEPGSETGQPADGRKQPAPGKTAGKRRSSPRSVPAAENGIPAEPALRERRAPPEPRRTEAVRLQPPPERAAGPAPAEERIVRLDRQAGAGRFPTGTAPEGTAPSTGIPTNARRSVLTPMETTRVGARSIALARGTVGWSGLPAAAAGYVRPFLIWRQRALEDIPPESTFPRRRPGGAPALPGAQPPLSPESARSGAGERAVPAVRGVPGTQAHETDHSTARRPAAPGRAASNHRAAPVLPQSRGEGPAEAGRDMPPAVSGRAEAVPAGRWMPVFRRPWSGARTDIRPENLRTAPRPAGGRAEPAVRRTEGTPWTFPTERGLLRGTAPQLPWPALPGDGGRPAPSDGSRPAAAPETPVLPSAAPRPLLWTVLAPWGRWAERDEGEAGAPWTGILPPPDAVRGEELGAPAPVGRPLTPLFRAPVNGSPPPKASGGESRAGETEIFRPEAGPAFGVSGQLLELRQTVRGALWGGDLREAVHRSERMNAALEALVHPRVLVERARLSWRMGTAGAADTAARAPLGAEALLTENGSKAFWGIPAPLRGRSPAAGGPEAFSGAPAPLRGRSPAVGGSEAFLGTLASLRGRSPAAGGSEAFLGTLASLRGRSPAAGGSEAFLGTLAPLWGRSPAADGPEPAASKASGPARGGPGTGMIHRRPEHRSDPASAASAGDEGEAVLKAQTVSPAQAAALNAAYSYPPGGGTAAPRPPEAALTREEEDRIAQRILEDINYNRMADEVLDRVERRLRAERRKFGR